jgi:hypothetical protein
MNRKDPAIPPTDAAATPFFARFLEDQHAADAKPAVQCQTLKYPSDRDEDDGPALSYFEAAPTNAKASNRSLKYPSDRDEIDPYVAPHGNAAGAS